VLQELRDAEHHFRRCAILLELVVDLATGQIDLEDLFVGKWPTFNHMFRLWGSAINDLGISELQGVSQQRPSKSNIENLIGVKVSKPLAADQGSPFSLAASCMLRAVMSMARTAGSMNILIE
jgi:hypothetical protein